MLIQEVQHFFFQRGECSGFILFDDDSFRMAKSQGPSILSIYTIL